MQSGDASNSLSQNTGVYIGIQQMEYGNSAALHVSNIGAFAATGSPFSVAAGRVSYTFGFKGPAVSLPAALVACCAPSTLPRCPYPMCLRALDSSFLCGTYPILVACRERDCVLFCCAGAPVMHIHHIPPPWQQNFFRRWQRSSFSLLRLPYFDPLSLTKQSKSGSELSLQPRAAHLYL